MTNPSVPIDPNRLYHGVYPVGRTGAEDDITPELVAQYEAAVGRRVAWVYFSHNWYQGRRFPLATARWIQARGSIPFIRLMLRSNASNPVPDPQFPLSRLLEHLRPGNRNQRLYRDVLAWGNEARRFGTPLIVEWGTEVNGSWFAWNAQHNGKEDGPRRFRDVFRRIVEIVSGDAGAQNITWVFHVNGTDWIEENYLGGRPQPQPAWNGMENYYPGDRYVDWLGISVYGAQVPRADEACEPLAPRLKAMHDRLAAKAPGKPVFFLEFGATAGHPNASANEQCQPDKWADAALRYLLEGSAALPHLRGFSWWNETWENGNDEGRPVPDTDMRVQATPALQAVFRRHLVGNRRIIDRPLR